MPVHGVIQPLYYLNVLGRNHKVWWATPRVSHFTGQSKSEPLCKGANKSTRPKCFTF